MPRWVKILMIALGILVLGALLHQLIGTGDHSAASHAAGRLLP
jgi:hypothetical protein